MRRMTSRSRRSSFSMRSAISGSTARRSAKDMPERYGGRRPSSTAVPCYLPGVNSPSFPSREAFRELARAGNLIPVYREILADGDTPVSAYSKLGRRDHSFLLESVVGGEKWAAYSFIGVEPRAVVRWQAGKGQVVWRNVDGTG